jgi:hypothetical protein
MRESLGCLCRGRGLPQEEPISSLGRWGGDYRKRSFRGIRQLFDQARRPKALRVLLV